MFLLHIIVRKSIQTRFNYGLILQTSLETKYMDSALKNAQVFQKLSTTPLHRRCVYFSLYPVQLPKNKLVINKVEMTELVDYVKKYKHKCFYLIF